MDHKIVGGRCEVCGATHGDIVVKGLECFLPEMASRRREELPATRVGVPGGPVKIATRFELEAVGVEWDGKMTPVGKIEYDGVKLVQAGILSLNEARELAAKSKHRTHRVDPVVVDGVREIMRQLREKNEARLAARRETVWEWRGTWVDWQNATSGNGIAGNAIVDPKSVHVDLTMEEDDRLFSDTFDLVDLLKKRWPTVKHWRFTTRRPLGTAGSQFHFDEEGS